MFIRYFARTDETEIGRAAVAYCKALIATGMPVRLVSAGLAEVQLDERGRSSSIWSPHRDLLTTPMDGDYVNVVCGNVADWGRFHTVGVTNALLLAYANVSAQNAPRFQMALLDAVARYDVVYAPTSDLAGIAEGATGLRPIVVPLGTPDAGSAFLRLKEPCLAVPVTT